MSDSFKLCLRYALWYLGMPFAFPYNWTAAPKYDVAVLRFIVQFLLSITTIEVAHWFKIAVAIELNASFPVCMHEVTQMFRSCPRYA